MSDRTDAIIAGLRLCVDGEDHNHVIPALSTMLAQAIADNCDTVDAAEAYAKTLGTAIGADIRKNWHLVTERRRAR